MTARPLAVQLYTVRDRLAADPATTIAALADLGFAGVEPVGHAGLPGASTSDWTHAAVGLKRLLDEHGLAVCAAHTALPERNNANAVFDEQELLGNKVMIVSSLHVVPGASITDLDTLDTLKRIADRFNSSAALAADRGMRIGYHNHFWEWQVKIHGRWAYEVFWEHLDPSVVAEVDIYWAAVAGQHPAEVIAALGPRAELVHVKDGSLVVGEPNMAVGSGAVDVAGALAAGEWSRWHIVEFDACATDLFTALRDSADWLVENNLSVRKGW